MKNKCSTVFLLYLVTFIKLSPLYSMNLTKEQKITLGKEIWKNETNKKEESLIFWNSNEKFLSLGIGHFIWYPVKSEKVFEQTFPNLLTLFKKRKILLPSWLNKAHKEGAPWKNKKEFDAAKKNNDSRLNDLKKLLLNTTDVQTDFIIERLYKTWPKILKNAPHNKRNTMKKNFEQLTKTYQGMFALIDYLNFKGTGINKNERYKGQGWGLLQVLEAMPNQILPDQTVTEFFKAAKKILSLRVANAPINKKHESKWLQGWIKRISKYPTFNL